MATRTVEFVPNEFYHVYNRGTEKRQIFKDHADYRRFMDLLFLSNSTESVHVRDIRKQHSSIFDFDRQNILVAIGTYCLMPNHFHILLTPLVDDGVSRFMNKLGTSYSMYFNKRYARTGSLFEGTYKARWIDTDPYLKYVFAYTHLNPVKLIQSDWKESGVRNVEVVMQYLKKYKYSSLMDYFGTRTESMIINPTKFPEYFTSKKEIDTELLEWLSYKETIPTIPG